MKIKAVVILFALSIFLTSLISASIIITQQPESSYNMGDIVEVPIKIKATNKINNFLTIELICNEKQSEVHKEFVSLVSGEEKEFSPAIPLIQLFTGSQIDSCSIKAILGAESKITDNFAISNKISILIKEGETQFIPGQAIIIEGDATKENQDFVDGFVDLTLENSALSETIQISDTIENGDFFVNFSLPENTKAGTYSVNINIYEKDFQNQITNTGSVYHNIEIKQVPTNLEILFETQEVEPGTNLRVKAVLHDQTGEKIKSTSTISVKNKEGTLLKQSEQPTDEFFEFPILYNQAPEQWSVFATSNLLETASNFNIIEKEEVKIDLLGEMVLITNIGNVRYNKTVVVKIGEESVSIKTDLGIDKNQEYLLTAPDGEYEIQIINDNGETIDGSAFLTGKAVDVKETGLKIGKFFRHPLVWVFIIIILVFVAFIIFRKGIKRTFLGHVPKNLQKDADSKPVALSKNSLIKSRAPAELSLSIKGDKQTVNVVALKIKNFQELQTTKSNAKETLQKLVDFAEERKVATYENQDNIFFILAPIKTKTFRNEKTAIEISQKAIDILKQYNKLAKQKIEFGIALTSGSIIAKQEANGLKFMSLGILITSSKKISNIANQDILLGKTFKEKTMANLKTEKQNKNGVDVYKITEIKKGKSANKKFIHQFVERYEKENKEKAKKKKS